MPSLHFISGLPRSGSKLLAAMLRQNPAMSASISSPVFSLVNGLMRRLSNANEFSVFLDDDARARILRGLFESYYAPCDQQLIFDTNRNWTAKLPVLLTLFPEARLGVRGLQDVRETVAARGGEITLPPDIVAWFGGTYFWETGNDPTKVHTLLAGN